MIVTYNRDAILSATLERLNRLPYLNKIVVVWNNGNRAPTKVWPRIHVPVVFVNVSKNSLNNRFLPYDQIKTESVLSMDDDIDLRQNEIIFAFRSVFNIKNIKNINVQFQSVERATHKIGRLSGSSSCSLRRWNALQ